jgi:hypothetical protein
VHASRPSAAGIVRVVALALVALAVTACGGSDAADGSADASGSATTPPVEQDIAPEDDVAQASDAEELFPDVIDATATFDGATWTVSATLSSPYDSPERYADAWRVVGPDGTVYGERLLTHDHAAEQPFTRSQSGIEIPDDVAVETIEGRDQVSGYGGAVFTLALTR